MKLRLEITPPGQPAFDFEHAADGDDAVVSIGRDPNCKLSLVGEGCKNVSWQHAALSLTGAGAFLTDLGSSNGTFVNGRRINGKVRLSIGDEVGLGHAGPKLRVVHLELTQDYTKTVAEKVHNTERTSSDPTAALKTAVPAKAGDGEPSSTRQILFRLEARQRRLWTFFGLGGAAVIAGLVTALVFISRPRDNEAYKRALPSTVLVEGEGRGTGALIDRKRKLVLTAFHVVGEQETVKVFFPVFGADGKVITDRKEFEKIAKPIAGKLVLHDRDKDLELYRTKDLALLQLQTVPDSAPEIKLAADSVRENQPLSTIGNPGDNEDVWVPGPGAARHVIFQQDYRIKNQFLTAWMVSMTVPVNPGDSGGPLLNDRGELVGVNCMQDKSQNAMAQAIDIREVHALLEKMVGKDKAK